MNTGVTTLSKLPELTAVYPFHGTEVTFSIALLGFFFVFIVWQIAMEAKHHKAIIGNFTASPAE
jgi:hypothetical protein